MRGTGTPSSPPRGGDIGNGRPGGDGGLGGAGSSEDGGGGLGAAGAGSDGDGNSDGDEGTGQSGGELGGRGMLNCWTKSHAIWVVLTWGGNEAKQ